MGKVAITDNYRMVIDGEEHTFYATTDRQAWYLAYEQADGELIDLLEEIDCYGNSIRLLTDDQI